MSIFFRRSLVNIVFAISTLCICLKVHSFELSKNQSFTDLIVQRSTQLYIVSENDIIHLRDIEPTKEAPGFYSYSLVPIEVSRKASKVGFKVGRKIGIGMIGVDGSDTGKGMVWNWVEARTPYCTVSVGQISRIMGIVENKKLLSGVWKSKVAEGFCSKPRFRRDTCAQISCSERTAKGTISKGFVVLGRKNANSLYGWLASGHGITNLNFLVNENRPSNIKQVVDKEIADLAEEPARQQVKEQILRGGETEQQIDLEQEAISKWKKEQKNCRAISDQLTQMECLENILCILPDIYKKRFELRDELNSALAECTNIRNRLIMARGSQQMENHIEKQLCQLQAVIGGDKEGTKEYKSIVQLCIDGNKDQ